MTARAVLPVEVVGADGLPLLDSLRPALSGAGPAVAPHASGRAPDPWAVRPLEEEEDAGDDPVAAVVPTTGSTGRAKHVLLPASSLLSSAGATHDALGGAGTWVLAVPAHTVAGVQVLVRSLVAGTRPVVVDLTGGFDPEAFAQAAAALPAGARRYTSLVPAQLDLLLEAAVARPEVLAALRCFDAVLVGGAALAAAVRERAAGAGVPVVTTYGMTETCGGCVYDGVPLPGVQVTLEPLPASPGPAGHGRVVLSGPVVARGYRTPGDVAHQGREAGDAGTAGEGFDVVAGARRFRTADRGELADGVLRVHGRTDDVVTSGGVNVALAAVDRVLRAQPGVRDCLVVAVPSQRWGSLLGALVVPAAGAPADGMALQEVVRRELGSAAVPRLLRHVDRLPLAGVGKPDRAAATALLGPVDALVPRWGDHGGGTEPDDPTEETT